MKVLKWLGAIVLVLIVVAFVGLMMFLNTAVKTAVEVGGPQVLGVPVTVGGVSVKLFQGKVVIKDLVVGNPEGYKSEYLFKLGQLDFELDTSTLGKDTMVIKKIHILNPQISYEQGLTANNISALLAQMEKEPDTAGEKPAESVEKEEASGTKTKVVIESFLLDEARVRVSAKLIGDKQLVVPLPPIEMKDIGKESDGASLVEVITRVIKAILGSVTSVVTGSVKLVGDGVGAAAGMAGDAVGAAAGVAGDAAGAIGGAAAGGAKAIGAGAKGLFQKAGSLLPGQGPEATPEADKK